MCGFIAQLVEHRTGIAEVTGLNPVEALIFFRLLLSNCLNWKIYCNDHSSLSQKHCVTQYGDLLWVSQVQYDQPWWHSRLTFVDNLRVYLQHIILRTITLFHMWPKRWQLQYEDQQSRSASEELMDLSFLCAKSGLIISFDASWHVWSWVINPVTQFMILKNYTRQYIL